MEVTALDTIEQRTDVDYYIVMVQDIGELLEYEFTDYHKAIHLFETIALPCALWACNRKTGKRVKIYQHHALHTAYI